MFPRIVDTVDSLGNAEFWGPCHFHVNVAWYSVEHSMFRIASPLRRNSGNARRNLHQEIGHKMVLVIPSIKKMVVKYGAQDGSANSKKVVISSTKILVHFIVVFWKDKNWIHYNKFCPCRKSLQMVSHCLETRIRYRLVFQCDETRQWSSKTRQFLTSLSRAKSRNVPEVFRQSVETAWREKHFGCCAARVVIGVSIRAWDGLWLQKVAWNWLVFLIFLVQKTVSILSHSSRCPGRDSCGVLQEEAFPKFVLTELVSNGFSHNSLVKRWPYRFFQKERVDLPCLD